jgi:hypothetical protein
MINFIEGQIDLDEKNIVSVSNCEDLSALAAKGLIEKREYSGGIYYYVDYVAVDMRFGIFISLKGKRIDYIALRWLDGPCTSKGWDDVSEKALKEEYHLPLTFVEKSVGRPPDNKKDRQRTWRFTWGQVEVSYQSRDFVTQIYMKPR